MTSIDSILSGDFLQTTAWTGTFFSDGSDYEYYKTIGTGSVVPGQVITTDVVYTNPTWSLINTAPANTGINAPSDTDPIGQRPGNNMNGAEQFCNFLGQGFVSYDATGTNNNDTVYYNDNNSEWRFDGTSVQQYNTITCLETTIGPPTTTGDTVVVNNKQLYTQLYDIKIMLFLFGTMYLVFGVFIPLIYRFIGNSGQK